jgi:hypothetical protein
MRRLRYGSLHIVPILSRGDGEPGCESQVRNAKTEGGAFRTLPYQNTLRRSKRPIRPGAVGTVRMTQNPGALACRGLGVADDEGWAMWQAAFPLLPLGRRWPAGPDEGFSSSPGGNPSSPHFRSARGRGEPTASPVLRTSKGRRGKPGKTSPSHSLILALVAGIQCAQVLGRGRLILWPAGKGLRSPSRPVPRRPRLPRGRAWRRG